MIHNKIYWNHKSNQKKDDEDDDDALRFVVSHLLVGRSRTRILRCGSPNSIQDHGGGWCICDGCGPCQRLGIV